MHQHYEALEKNKANYVPLSPLSFIQRTADLFGDRTALIYGARRYSWSETYGRCRSLASALVKMGLGLGDTVSVIAANTPEMFEAHFGVPMAGCVLNTLNTRIEAETIAYILDNSDSQLLIVDTAFHETVIAALKLLNRDIAVIDIRDPAMGDMPNIGDRDYEDFIASGDVNYDWNLPEDEWQALALGYTSGTSGRPKGVVYHHRGSYLMSVGTVTAWELQHHPTYLYVVPMFHCNGWGHAWTMTLMAATIVLTRTISAEAIFGDIEKHKITHFGGAPIVLSLLVNAPEATRPKLDYKIKVLTAGAPPPAAMLEKTAAMGLEVMQVYGLTETYGHVTQCLWRSEWDELTFSEQADIQSWQGIAFPVAEGSAVVNSETGNEVPRDGETQGEIVIRGNIVMKGYYKDADATAAAMRDGWFYSGDAAVWHKNGYVQIKDRLKDVIISGGENISSVEVEGYLYRHPDVVAAAVVAKPDEKWGEVPCAFVEVKDGATITEDELMEWCRGQMAGFKRPKVIKFGELPKTSTGKIQKFILRQTMQT
ncbi:acyl-CoA synthetase [Candidatus Puniceispirillum sp.]|uniref:acyl-CoA synthetase n=1 Tax=Candidatus Puniceispirillum sp. TaxID=2026719 RepID=UPI001EB4AB56|nr:acyl-CoA synthetase [Candidatus Puniceispirillum sp.]